MMNKENKVMNALVSLQVCPKCNGASECCKACDFVDTHDCSAKLTAKCMDVLNEHFKHGKTHVDTSTAPDYEGYVSGLLREIGIPAHIKGYRHARYAIILSANDPDYVDAITCRLYPDVAKAFNDTASRVERAIRHAIEVAWDRGDLDVLMHYFGNTIDGSKGKPTNSEFIATMADHVKRHFRDSSSK